MKVFISWSGELGKEFAKILYEWFPSVLQAVKPFYSPDDIAKGARWSADVSKELDESQIGIVVVTEESLLAPWIMFESGALSKNVGKSKVVPILLDVEVEDIPGPLMQFQCASFEVAEMKRVLRMINSELRDASLQESVLESVFQMWWPELEKKTKELLSNVGSTAITSDGKTEKEILDEILGLTKSIAKRQSEGLNAEEIKTPTIDDEDNEDNWIGSLSINTVRKRLNQGGNLVGANLMNLNLAKMDLSNANMQGANLVGANLSKAKLSGANFHGANLEGAILDKADVQQTVFDKANLWRASMIGIKNLSLIKSMHEANTYGIQINPEDKEVLSNYKTLSIRNYPLFYKYFQKNGISKEQLREIFLWTAHSYPSESI